MAQNRRMFSNRIANSAKFLQMPTESQLLYFHMILRADDDGIVEAYPLMKLLGSGEDNFKVLAAKGFIKQLNEDQVIVITDWLEHNKIRADRKIDSIYLPLLLKIAPELPIIEPKHRSDRPEQEPNTRSHELGRPKEINTNGTEMGRHKLSQVKLSKDNNIYISLKETFNDQITIPNNEHTGLLEEEKAKFLDYWQERSPGGRKERWQMEKVFDIRRRWRTWIANVEKRLKPKEFVKLIDNSPRGTGGFQKI